MGFGWWLSDGCLMEFQWLLGVVFRAISGQFLGVMGDVLLAAMDVLWWSCWWRFQVVFVGVLVTGRGVI